MAKSIKTLSHVATDLDTNEYLKINNCGTLRYKAAAARNIRPKGRNDYSLLFITDGCCYLNIDSDSPKAVKKGNVIIYSPSVPQDYSFLANNTSEELYIHFSGTGCAEITESLGLPRFGILDYQKNNEIENYLFKLCEAFDNTDPKSAVYCKGMLLSVLSLLAQLDKKGRSESLQHSRVIGNIIGQIRSNPAESYSIEKWAKECGFTRPYFIELFKKTAGMAPHQYLTHTRMRYAKEMLLFTDMPVSKIGEICGYTDYNYFSRIFKKIEGISPAKYRKNR